jgi:D-arabinose 1-dehydrogenase-like Zn-dependent alcohol dehydrogenase
MKALVLKKPGEASIETVPDPLLTSGNVMLRVRMVGFCGSDVNSFHGSIPWFRIHAFLVMKSRLQFSKTQATTTGFLQEWR